MATKGNARVGYNKEAVSSFHEYVRTLNMEIDEKINAANASYAYLLAEENVSGKDAESFLKSVEGSRKALTTIKAKVDQLEKATGTIVSNLGITSSKNTKKLEEAKQDFGKALIQLKQAGK